MKKEEHNIHFNKSQRISHVLMLNSSFLTDVGLYEGKIGIAIAFAELFRHTSIDVYNNCMSNLLDNALENTHKELTFNFKSGLSGIGWGIYKEISKIRSRALIEQLFEVVLGEKCQFETVQN